MKNKLPVCTCDKCYQNFNTIFRHLSPEELEELNYQKDCQAFKKGSVLYHEGSRLTGFYCINSGIIKIYKTGTEGKEQIIRFAKPGDIIGYRSVLNEDLACTTAKTIDDVSVCFIPSTVLYNLIKTNSSFSFDMIKLVCTELGEANTFITDIAQKTVRERLAEVLLLLKTSFGITDEGYLNITLTREELANLVGTATESVIRLLSDFKSDNLVELQGKKIKIINESKLMKAGNIFDQ